MKQLGLLALVLVLNPNFEYAARGCGGGGGGGTPPADVTPGDQNPGDDPITEPDLAEDPTVAGLLDQFRAAAGMDDSPTAAMQ